MHRRVFLTSALAAQAASAQKPVIERSAEGKPHTGKVLALITPHLDDGPIFAGGTLAKLMDEGYAGYFIRTSNDEKDSFGMTLGETVLANERDTQAFIKTIGFKKAYDLAYRNHRMDDIAMVELRARLIFLFRLLKVNTVFSYDPWGHYEENPDHYVTARAVESACWMSGGDLDLPEHFDAGLKPHAVSEKYYFARGPQLVNRVVDISATLQQKQACIRACRTMVDHMVQDLRRSLGRKVAALEAGRDQAVAHYAKVVFERRDASVGARHGLKYAEEFHYIGPDPTVAALF